MTRLRLLDISLSECSFLFHISEFLCGADRMYGGMLILVSSHVRAIMDRVSKAVVANFVTVADNRPRYIIEI